MPTTASLYYQQMKSLADEKRGLYGIVTSKLNLNEVRQIYKAEGITIDPWNLKGNKIKACYFADEAPSVMVRKDLPREPKLFALVHELKHHYVDRDSILNGEHRCGAYNENELIEIGAEVFAAQFIYPDAEMMAAVATMKISADNCSPEMIVHFKRSCDAVVSYTFIVKRFERYRFLERGAYARIQFKKLEEKIFGVPIYKRPSFIANRKRRAQNRR
jgi:Zn-dependent peptidase ImmA (M78 family)